MDQQQHDTAWRDGDKAHLTVHATYSNHAWIIGGHGALITDDSEHIVRVEPEDGSDDELTPEEDARISRQLAAEAAARILAPRTPLARGSLAGHVDEVIRLARYITDGHAADEPIGSTAVDARVAEYRRILDTLASHGFDPVDASITMDSTSVTIHPTLESAGAMTGQALAVLADLTGSSDFPDRMDLVDRGYRSCSSYSLGGYRVFAELHPDAASEPAVAAEPAGLEGDAAAPGEPA